MTSFPDYGLKAQGIERHSVDGGYRSVFQPYAGMYVVFWYVCVFQLYGLTITSSAGPLFSFLLAAYRYSGISMALISLRHVSRRPPPTRSCIR